MPGRCYGSGMTMGAAELLRSVGLSADGPAILGRGVRAGGPGVYVVELPSPLPTAPLDIHALSGWLARVPTLELDGLQPTSKQLLARLSSFWIPSATVLYVGASERSIGGRVAALEQHVLGDPRPHAAAHWLKPLRVSGLRVWWASTNAPEEYEDALLDAFAATVPADERAALHDPTTVLPFANLRTATGQPKNHGLRRSTLVPEVEPVAPPTRVVDVPPGDAEGSRPEPKNSGTTRRTNRSPVAPRALESRATAPGPRAPRPGSQRAAARTAPAAAPVILSADGLARMRTELEELTRIRRPEVIDRVRLARQLGDLRENSEYAAAREEQSFLEGRIQQLEAQLRTAVVAETASDDGKVAVGHTVTVEVDGERRKLTIVGARESDPGAGRISYASPVGQALIGRAVGDEAIVRTPGGEVPYRIVSIDA
jgi:transcription elongation factor GreA